MCQSSLRSVMISLLMSSVDEGGESVVKVVRAISDAKEARSTCDTLNAQSNQLAGKLDAITNLMESWANCHQDDDATAYCNAYDAKLAEFRDTIFGDGKSKEIPLHVSEVPYYWIDTVTLD